MADTVNHLTRLEVGKAQVMVLHQALVLLHLVIHLPRQRSMRLRVQGLYPRHLLEEAVVEQVTLLLHLESTLPRPLSRLQAQDFRQPPHLSLLHHLHSLHPVRDSVHPHRRSRHHHHDSRQAVQHSRLLHHDSRLPHHHIVLPVRNTVLPALNTHLLLHNTRLLVRDIALLVHSIVLRVPSIARLVLNIVQLAQLCHLLLPLMMRKSRRLPMGLRDTHLVQLVSSSLMFPVSSFKCNNVDINSSSAPAWSGNGAASPKGGYSANPSWKQ